ncbi:MAG: fatty acid desaturase [Rickettsiaceae bacterium]|nr:fatty acid desaturase [Rickettsiaceae bacterium]
MLKLFLLVSKGKLKGFFWSHIGWMLVSKGAKKHIERGTLKRLGKNKIVMWQFKNYWKIAILVNTLIPFCIGYAIGGNLQYALAGFIFIGIGRAIQQQATFCINSLVHFFGSKKYVNGTAGDIPALFFMFLGENWHNFHHAFPRDYRNGHKWYHLDIHKWIIALLEKLGLARNVVRTPNERIKAKIELTKQQLTTNINNQLDQIDLLFNKLVRTLTKEIETNLDQANNKLVRLKQKTLFLGEKIKEFTRDSKKIKQKEIEKILTKLRKLESEFAKYQCV